LTFQVASFKAVSAGSAAGWPVLRYRSRPGRCSAAAGLEAASPMSVAISIPASLPASDGAVTLAPRPLDMLILGGTGFLGPHQLRHALARGHRVTIFHRGERAVALPAAVEVLHGDRAHGDYRALQGRRFDVCIDNPTCLPSWVQGAASVLRGQIGHYVFVSTVSVYASHARVGQDEQAPRAAPPEAGVMPSSMKALRENMAWYGPLKALCEDEAHRQFPGITTVVRPGLIVGPGDETDRFTYWPLRLQRGGAVLVPPQHDPVMWIDARDLAEWTIHLAEQHILGDYNALGPGAPQTMADMLRQIAAATGHRAQFVEVSRAFLDAQGVAPWSDLPVWVPGEGDTAGFHRRSNRRALEAGLHFRPLAETTTDLLAWWATLDEARRTVPRAGLAAEREAALLALV
jgi:2'-hydroxyisoflavone reductase